MSTVKRKVTEFNVTWEADHEQYWQGHGIALSNYVACATGCGDTLREAAEDALESLAQDDIELTSEQEQDLLERLEDDLNEDYSLDTTIVESECNNNCGSQDEDSDSMCAVCAGEWHFYVNVDVKLAE